jgi:hypothetical protein
VHYCSEITARLGAGADVYDWLNNPRGPKSPDDVWKALEAFAPEQTNKPFDRANVFPTIMAADVEAVLSTDDLVENLLIASQLSVVFGPANVGKSFFVVDLALHIALGWKWRDRDVEQGGVLYVAAEGQAYFDRDVENVTLQVARDMRQQPVVYGAVVRVSSPSVDSSDVLFSSVLQIVADEGQADFDQDVENVILQVARDMRQEPVVYDAVANVM